MPPAPSTGIIAGADAANPAYRNPFPFAHRSNTLDRDRIVVPAGWDSWGKIVVLREGFEPKSWGEAWESDLEAEGDAVPDNGARKQYCSLIPDMSINSPTLPPFNNPIPEQTFLAKNYDENAKKPDRDPRGAFRNPNELAATAAGVVGPMGNSSFNLPSVERAWEEMEKGIGSVSASSPSLGSSVSGPRGTGGQPSRTGRPHSGLANLSSSLGIGVAGGAGSKLTPSPGLASNPSPTGQTQHEVLQNFFQSLLSSKDRAGAANLPKPGSFPAKVASPSSNDAVTEDASP